MREKFNNYTDTRPRLKKVAGWLFLIVGFFALITPLTPGGLLFFVGLEILGIRLIFMDKIKRVFVRPKIK